MHGEVAPYNMSWSKNHLLLPNCVSVFFPQCHNINIKNQSTPGAHAVFPVGGVWTHLEGCVTQSLFSENVYENERVASYGGYALEHFVISANA